MIFAIIHCDLVAIKRIGISCANEGAVIEDYPLCYYPYPERK